MIDVSEGKNVIVCVGTVSCDGLGAVASSWRSQLREGIFPRFSSPRGIGGCFCAAGDLVGLEYSEMVIFLIEYEIL